MAQTACKTSACETSGEGALADLDAVRERTERLVAHLDDADLERLHSPILSPLVWDLAHIAAYEDLWLAHRFGGHPLLREDLAAVYDAFETPRSIRGKVPLLDATAARAYMTQVRERVAEITLHDGVGDGVLHEMVLRHELQHTETMLQTMSLADLLPPAGSAELPHPREADPMSGDESWAEIPSGRFELGARPEGFSYDNERQCHAVELPGFRIARHPVSNRQWHRFCEWGGYERREWWSDDGWEWLQATDPIRDPRAGEGPEDAAVCHVSFHEAQAFARSLGARLPTEAEWERAAGDPAAQLAGVAEVWEWTSSAFAPYPGFVAHPYREYSEVFFGKGYRVLRGGSWATHPRVGNLTFRNWDLPQRRQIFAGLRLATDLPQGAPSRCSP
jgi:iron(II)-dependent oxidoreductase